MGDTIPLLLYHSIDTECADLFRRWMMLPEEFDSHIRALRDAGYNAVTVADLVAAQEDGRSLPPRAVVITFDDGLRDFLTGAMPILSTYGFRATLFVVSGKVGQTSIWLAPLGEGGRRMLSWPEIRELDSAGIEIGAHTVTHPELDVLSAARSRAEIAESKRRIEDGLGAAIQSFAYPHGYASRTTRKLVKEAGYRSACRVRHAFSSTDENPYALSRVIMTSEIKAKDLLDLLSGRDLPVAPPVDRLLTHGWRTYRRIRYATKRLQGMSMSRLLPS